MDVGHLQRKLSTWAEQDSERKFYGLHKLLCTMEWLDTAHEHVKRNRGSMTAGTDGITMQDFDEDMEGNLRRLQEDLKAGTFEPCPVRRVLIPKAKGGKRPLGIASIRDRIVQEGLRMILEPIFEADFCDRSYGFRPNRCTMDAIAYIGLRLNNRGKYFWIIEGDISSYFDTIKHRKLLRLVRRRVKDERLLTLLWKFLRAGVMEGKLFRDTKQGTPQGGIVSPLLANIYLHELDRFMTRYTALSKTQKQSRRTAGKANFLYVRYADDFVVLCNGTREQAVAMRQELQAFLKTELKLALSMEKTKVTHLNDGFTFLGFWIQRAVGMSGKRAPRILIPDDARRRFLDKMKQALAPATTHASVHTKILGLNRIINGWGRYYQYTSSPKYVFGGLDHQVFWMMAHWLGRKYKCSMPHVMRKFYGQNTLRTPTITLKRLDQLATRRYKVRVIPNPYTQTDHRTIWREDAFSLDDAWAGCERRPGQADWRDLVLERDGPACAICGRPFDPWELELDHRKPVARFQRAKDAEYPENFQMLCTSCHRNKTRQDRQVLSRVR